jgi:hypothetical protein
VEVQLYELVTQVVSFKIRPLYPQGVSRYPFNRSLGGPQSPAGHGEEKHLFHQRDSKPVKEYHIALRKAYKIIDH